MTERRTRIIDHRVVKGSDLLPNPENWRRHPPDQRAAITSVLDRLGYVDEVKAVETPDGLMLMDGHLRAQIGANDNVPVAVVDLTTEEQRLFLATFDPIAAMAVTEPETYANLIQMISTEEDEILARLLAGVKEFNSPLTLPRDEERDARSTAEKLTEVEASEYQPLTQRGQVWQLGEHRVMCGDAIVEADIRLLMSDDRAILVVTDPPYLVGYDGGRHPESWSNSPRVKDKKWDEYQEQDRATGFYVSFIKAAMAYAVVEDAAWYQWYASLRAPEVHDAWREANLLTHAVIVWVKSRPVLTHSRYMWQHELCVYGWKQGYQPVKKPPANARTVWQIDQAGDGRFEHPTQKPVALICEAISHQSSPGDLCYDPFVGSGTTIIAAEKLGRRCFAMEIEPRYCDVAIRRWEEFTGQHATLQGDDITFNQLAAQRSIGLAT